MDSRLKTINEKFNELAILVMEDFSREDVELDLERLRSYKKIENLGNMMVDLTIKGTGKDYIKEILKSFKEA